MSAPGARGTILLLLLLNRETAGPWRSRTPSRSHQRAPHQRARYGAASDPGRGGAGDEGGVSPEAAAPPPAYVARRGAVEEGRNGVTNAVYS